MVSNMKCYYNCEFGFFAYVRAHMQCSEGKVVFAYLMVFELKHKSYEWDVCQKSFLANG